MISANDGEAIENELIYGEVHGIKKTENGNELAGAVTGVYLKSRKKKEDNEIDA